MLLFLHNGNEYLHIVKNVIEKDTLDLGHCIKSKIIQCLASFEIFERKKVTWQLAHKNSLLGQ